MKLWQKMLVAIIGGVLVGYILSPHGIALFNEALTKDIAAWIALPGAIFMALIKMIVIPLVVSSVSLAVVGSENLSRLKTTGLGAIFYFVTTTIIAVVIGILVASIIKPGNFVPEGTMITTKENISKITEIPVIETRPSLPEMVTGLLPTNPAKAVIDRSMMQIVIGSILMGIALLSIGAVKAKPLVDILQSIQDVVMKIVDWAMAIAPLAVFSFLCNLTIKTGPDTLSAMAAYVGAVLLGLLFILGLYMILVALIGRISPIQFLSSIKDAQILAFSSSSSAATMPLTLKIAIEKLKIRKDIANFIIPLGTTINMDGTAIYQVIAALFLVQIFGIELSFVETIILSITIIGASIGSPGTPGVGLVILATILTNIGVAPAGVAMILGVDRILDMCRTTINVTGDLTASVVMNKIIKNKLSNGDNN